MVYRKRLCLDFKRIQKRLQMRKIKGHDTILDVDIHTAYNNEIIIFDAGECHLDFKTE